MARKLSRPPGRTRTATPQKSATATAAVKASPRARSHDEELVENLFLGVLLFFLAVLIYIPVFNAGFIWDDDQLLTANMQVRNPQAWEGFKSLWLQGTADYFPLTSSTLWLEWRLWGMNAGGYHITNVLLHAITSVLTWQTLKRLRVPGAWIAAAIFAVHPVCVESVAWISERKNTISQIFFLLSIIHYVRFEEKGRVWRYVAAVLCFTLSLLAKTSVVMLPFILLLLAWWRHRELETLRPTYQLDENPAERRILLFSCAAAGAIVGGAASFISPMLGVALALVVGGSGFVVGTQIKKIKPLQTFAGFELIRTIPFFLVAFILGAVTIYFQYGRAIGGEEIPMGNIFQRTASACFAAGFYLYSAFWPFNLIEIYPEWHRAFTMVVTQPRLHIDPPKPEAIPYYFQILPGIILAGLLGFCWTRRTQSWARAILVGLGCYLIAILPALGLLKMSYMRLTLVADHFQYISLVAVIALVVAAGRTRAMRPLWLCLASLFFLIVTVAFWNQTQDNRIAEFIWILGPLVLAAATAMEDGWKYVWGAFIATVLLCFGLISNGLSENYKSEKALWSATLDKNPFSWQAHNHLGAALYMEGNWRGAAPHFLKATQLKSENPESHNNLGLTYSMAGDMPDAIREYETAVGIKDDSAMRTNLANAYEQVKDYDKAIENYHHAISLSDTNASAHCNLGYALMQQGLVDQAIPEFMRTIELDPQMPQGRADLARALQMRGINVDAPEVSGSYPFDANRALHLLHAAGPLPEMPQPPPPPQQ
jgi:tetratricopeptide (TPR) repeat protein